MRSIVHLDADAFFASVEQASDPRLRGKPIAVGGEKRGIIASASYEARKFGIYTPMPTALARRLCPKLILLPGDFDKYELFSRLMFSYAYDFTPDVEIGSIDEGYFDLTGARKPALGIAETVRNAIRQALKLPVSEGLASNKLVSQIASKFKKPAAFEYVPSGNEASFLSPLPNQWLPGIGPKTASQLNAAGLPYIGQIAQVPLHMLSLLVGGMAPQLRNFSLGIDERPVIPIRAAAKSYSEQETFAADTTDEEFLKATLRRMADHLMAKIRADAKSIRTLTVKVRYNDMDEEQASESLPEPTDLETEIYSLTTKLLRKAWRRRVSLRLVSLKLSNVYDGRFRGLLPLDASARQHDAQQRLVDVVDTLRQKFGSAVLLRGHDFVLRDKHDQEAEAKSEDRKPKAEGNPKTETRSPKGTAPSSFQQTVIQRQRIGNSFAHAPIDAKVRPVVTSSPAPELRFRVELNASGSNATSASLGQSKITNLKSKVASIPLNLHSHYSFLDSTLSIPAIVELAQRQHLPAVALTDKNNLHGAVEFAQATLAAGIKPIIGAELNWHGHRLCLYVQNQTGYANLCRILSQNVAEAGNPKAEVRTPKEIRSSNSEQRKQFDLSQAGRRLPSDFALRPSFGFRPSAFEFPTEGLLVVSSSPDLAPFFPDRFYLEVSSLDAFEKFQQSNNPSIHQSTNPSIPHSALRTLHSALPLVASLPVHYASAADRWKYDILQSIRTLTLLRQAHPGKRLGGELHLRSPAEMQRLFAAHPELLANTLEIADRCSFSFTLGTPQFPSYPTPDGSPPAVFLRRLVMDGLRRRYPKEHARHQSQLEQELAIITEVGYEEYFLVMWDILQECRRQGIDWITRGSAADSLACYCLEISNVCPIRFDLYFRRFLNKERMALNKLPDIDVDFPHDRKDDVIDLIFKKYGPEHTAIVGGFSTFQSRSAFAEVAKVLGVSEFQVRRITERLPHFSRASELPEAVASSLECRDLLLDQEPYSTALQMAQFLDGFPRYPKMHPCGLVLSRQPMHEITPTFVSAKGYPTTHFDMDSVEAVGLIKMDILAQGGLAVMRDVREMLEQQNPKSGVQSAAHSVQSAPFEIQNSKFEIPTTFDDPAIWDLIASGNARAVHHIESPAMLSLAKMCNVHDIDTLIAIVSVIRPGAANENKKMEFARRYQGLSPVLYPHPSLEPCLRSTYGLVVYEEHILQICEAFAGLPPGRADILRRALGKEKNSVIAQIQTEFIDCARRRGRTETEIAEVWNLVTGFRGYAFCKAHSTAYGVEAYQSAWLKLHYPVEFMAAVLTNGKGFYSPLVYILECHRLGIPLLPPSINAPGPAFAVTRVAPPVPEAGNPKEIRMSNSAVHSSQFEVQCSTFEVPASSFALPSTQHATRNTPPASIRIPLSQLKGLTTRTLETTLRERARGPFASLVNFFHRVRPLPEEMQLLIRVGAFDDFGQPRTLQFWEYRALEAGEENPKPETRRPMERKSEAQQLPLENADFAFQPAFELRHSACGLSEPSRLDRLRAEEELLGYPVSGHPLELFPDIAWDTYCPVSRLGQHIGEQIVTCGLVIEQRLFHQVTGEPMKFITIADRTGIVETELFAKTYKSYGLNTVRYRVLEITAIVEAFENGGGFTLRVLRAGKPRTHQPASATIRRV
jgi:DNA-directed DNA polymerase III PolC